MGTCCSKRDRNGAGASINAAPHPSHEQQETHNGSQLSELSVVADGDVCIREKSQGTPSVNYGVKNLICESDFQSLRTLGTHVVQLREEPCINSQSVGKLSGFSDRNYTSNDGGLVMNPHLTIVEPDDELLPTFSFPDVASQSDEANLFNDVAFGINLTRKLGYGVNIDNSDGIKFEVRYKHMFPQDVQCNTINYMASHNGSAVKRSRSYEKMLAGDPEESRRIRHRRSFQETIIDYDLRCEKEENMLELRYGCVKGGGLVNKSSQLIVKEFNEDEDDDDEFHDITVGVSIASLHADRAQLRKEDIKHCISTEVSSHSRSPSVDLPHANDVNCMPNALENNEKGSHHLNSEIFKFKQSVYVLSHENMQFISGEEKERQERGEAMGGDEDKVNRMQALSVVSTGDAILFSGSNSDELHLIPSKFVQHHQPPPSSPKENLSPPRLITIEAHEERQEKPPLSVEDIILLLENDELNEDDLVSLLIDTKSSSSSSPSSSSSRSSSSSLPSIPRSSSSTSTSLLSLSLSSSSSVPYLSSSSMPCLSSSSMPWLSSSSTSSSSSLSYPLSQPSACKMSSQTSFEFKVKSCNSTPSTPMFSPIRSRTKRNIAQLKPTALTTEEIAEIWGVFEQRQAAMSVHM